MKGTGGKGADILIETASSPKVWDYLLDLMAAHGRMSVFGLYPQAQIQPLALIRKGVTLYGDVAFLSRHFMRAIDWLSSGKVSGKALVTKRFTLDQAGEAFEAFKNKETVKCLFEVMSGKVRLASIGAGMIGQVHAKVLARLDECEYVALCDMDPAKEKMAAELGTKYYRDHREMMDREKPDGVVVSVPNEMHETRGPRVRRAGHPRLHGEAHHHDARVGRPADRGRAEAQGEARLRPPPPVQPEDQRRARRDPLGRAGQPRGRERVLVHVQAVRVLRGGGVAPAQGRRPDPDQHDPRDRQPPLRLRGDLARVRGGQQQDPGLRGRGHGERVGALQETARSRASSCPTRPRRCGATSRTSGENPFFHPTTGDIYHYLGTKASLTFPGLVKVFYPDPAKAGWQHPLSMEQLRAPAWDTYIEQMRHFCRVVKGEEEPRTSGEDARRTLEVIQAVAETGARRTGRSSSEPGTAGREALSAREHLFAILGVWRVWAQRESASTRGCGSSAPTWRPGTSRSGLPARSRGCSTPWTSRRRRVRSSS